MMKSTLFLAAALLPFTWVLAQPDPAPAEPEAEVPAETEDISDRVLIALGFLVVQNTPPLALPYTEEEQAIIIEGMRQAMAGEPEPEDFAASRMAVNDLLEKKMQAQRAERAQMAAGRSASVDAFLAQLAEDQPGLVTTASGLRYIVEDEGYGNAPSAGDQVRVHYTGTLMDGTVFDSSRQRGQPATFPVGGVIPGFREGLLAMREGARYRLFIPADIGYGQNPPPGSPIQPGSLLIFDLELLEVISSGGPNLRMPPGPPPDRVPPPPPTDMPPPPPGSSPN